MLALVQSIRERMAYCWESLYACLDLGRAAVNLGRGGKDDQRLCAYLALPRSGRSRSGRYCLGR